MNELKKRIKNRPIIGIWSIISSPKLAEVLSTSGIDFIIFDREHGHFSDKSLEDSIRACEQGHAFPLVRISSLNLQKSQIALDAGSYGIIAPKINNKEEAKKLVEISLLPPYGERGFNPFTRAGNFYNNQSNQINKFDKDFPLICGIVETQEGIRNLDDICKVDHLDVVYIGIYDLSVDLGFNGDTSNKDLLEIVNALIIKIHKYGKYAGMMVHTHEGIGQAVELGAKFIVYSVDTSLIYSLGESISDKLKNLYK